MICRIYCSQAQLMRGFAGSGAQLAEEAVAFARRDANAHSLAWVLCVAAHSFSTLHEPHITARFASEAITRARDHDLPQWLALAERCLGWAMHRLGNFAEGLALQLQGVKRWSDSGAMLHLTHCEVLLAESLLREGRTVEARSHIDIANTHRATYRELYLAAEIDRLQGLLLQAEHAPFEIVEQYLLKSLETARRQDARRLAIRSATTFARMLVDNGQRGRATDILAPIFDWFTEDFEAADLQLAKVLLNELR